MIQVIEDIVREGMMEFGGHWVILLPSCEISYNNYLLILIYLLSKYITRGGVDHRQYGTRPGM